MRKIAVIGGSGFVGCEVIKQLQAAGSSIVNIDCTAPPTGNSAPWISANLMNKGALEAALQGCTDIIFLAAEWRDDVRPVSKYYDVNVTGADNVIQAAESIGIQRCVFTSSVSVYGPTEFEVPESFPTNPINDYGKSKLLAEKKFEEWHDRDGGAFITIVRPTVIFGPKNRGNVWNLLNQIANGPFLMIGNGENFKSIAYVQNISAFLIYSLEFEQNFSVFNYSDKPDISVKSLVTLVRAELGINKPMAAIKIPYAVALVMASVMDLFSKLSGVKFRISRERVFKFCANTQYSAEAVRKTNFVPPVSITEALATTIKSEFSVLK